jgi:hypothetical protein
MSRFLVHTYQFVTNTLLSCSLEILAYGFGPCRLGAVRPRPQQMEQLTEMTIEFAPERDRESRLQEGPNQGNQLPEALRSHSSAGGGML